MYLSRTIDKAKYYDMEEEVESRMKLFDQEPNSSNLHQTKRRTELLTTEKTSHSPKFTNKVEGLQYIGSPENRKRGIEYQLDSDKYTTLGDVRSVKSGIQAQDGLFLQKISVVWGKLIYMFGHVKMRLSNTVQYSEMLDENYTETAFYEESKEITSLNENDTEWYKK